MSVPEQLAEQPVETVAARIVQVAAFPFSVILGFGLYFVLLRTDLPVFLSAGISCFVVLILVILHEIWLPYRIEWKPTLDDIHIDLAFLLTSKVLVPAVFLVAVTDAIQEIGIAPTGLWPHSWPVVVQGIMVLLLTEFIRYWVHRTFHKISFLWRFHIAHHNPHRLYWLISTRFHPFEDTIKYVIQTLPFVAMSISSEVLMVPFLIIAFTGFYQHSNCQIKFGPLNYVVHGPELHRWHHSEVVEESEHNYGHSLIIWDVIFRTWFLPRGREVGPLGLVGQYPTSYLRQLTAPFQRPRTRAAFWRRNLGHTSSLKGTPGSSAMIRFSDRPIGK